MPTCQCLSFCFQCLTFASLVFPPFSVFKFCIMNTLLHFLLLRCQPCRSLRNVSFGGCTLGLIKSAYHSWLSMMMSSEGPLFSLASGTPTLNPPLIPQQHFLHSHILFHLDNPDPNPVERESISNPNPTESKYPAGLDSKIRILYTTGTCGNSNKLRIFMEELLHLTICLLNLYTRCEARRGVQEPECWSGLRPES